MASLLVLIFYQPGEKGDYLRAPIYDETADASKQIDSALVVAKKENKRGLLQFGANWCVWCRVLHHLFEADKAVRKELQSDYIVVLVDVNRGHNEVTTEKFGEPTRLGLPVLVVLDSDGKQLVTQRGADFGENGGYSSPKVLAFLSEWAVK